jgi:hypothetical protein
LSWSDYGENKACQSKPEEYGCQDHSKYTLQFAKQIVPSNRWLGVLRQAPTADARIQRIEERVQPTFTRLTSGHLLQDLAHFRGGVLNRPADLAISDARIASVVELKGQGGIGRWADNVLGLMDIRQWMRVCGRGSKARGASGVSCGRITGLPCCEKRFPCQGAQPSRAIFPTGKPPDAFNRSPRAGI